MTIIFAFSRTKLVISFALQNALSTYQVHIQASKVLRITDNEPPKHIHNDHSNEFLSIPMLIVIGLATIEYQSPQGKG